MEYALKQGCQAAKLLLYANNGVSFELRNGRMDRLQQASECGLSISLYVDGRYGIYSTNRLDRKELESFIANSIESTRHLAPDSARVLPDPARYYKGNLPDLQLFDNRFYDLSPDEKLALARATADEVMGKDQRIVSVDTSYRDGENASYRLASNGFEGESSGTWFYLSASVSIKGEGDSRPADSWSENSLFYHALPKTDIGTRALERVLRKSGQRKVKSGKYIMVIDPLNANRLLSPLISALYGSALQQHNSFLQGRLNTPVASPLLTLRDEPHLQGSNGARYFDNEGVATAPRLVFEEGILRTYFIDTYHALKMGMPPTVSTPSILILQPGNQSLDALIADVPSGILVTGFNGGNCNSSTGNFSYGIEGFLIENGRLTHPINEMNVTGNMTDLWNALIAVGNDPMTNRSWRIPSLVFEGVSFSGL